MDAAQPVLWHLKVSPYNEKARWALDHKRIPHVRRAVIPGRHQAVARRLSGGNTLPVLELDGEAIGDSTQIIAALERRVPEPALYPPDPSERKRALSLEDFFDEEFGPHVRHLLIHHLRDDGKLMLGVFASDLKGVRRWMALATFPLLRRRVTRWFAIDEQSVAHATEALRVAGERFRAELQPSGYLVGDRFTVADLTLASMVAPVAAPEQFPYPQPQRDHPRIGPLRDVLAGAGLVGWALEMYARHRGSSAATRG
jgi:glutathione S-transferase